MSASDGAFSGLPARPPKPEAIRSANQSTRVRTQSPVKATDSRPPPVVNPAFFDGRNSEELHALLNDTKLQNALYLSQCPVPAQYAEVLSGLEDEELTTRGRIEALRPNVLEKRFEVENSLIKTRELEKEWENVQRTMYAVLKPSSSEALYNRLQTAVVESEKTSDSLAASFLESQQKDSSDAVTDFIKEYRQARKTFHLRSERLARMKEGRVGGLR